MVALLTVGSKKSPKQDVLQIGEAGNKQLVQVKEEGEKGLSAFFEKEKSAFKAVMQPNGLPPFPATLLKPLSRGSRYEILKEQTYGTNVQQYVKGPFYNIVLEANLYTATHVERSHRCGSAERM